MSKKDNIQYTAYESYTMLADRELRALKMKNSGTQLTGFTGFSSKPKGFWR